SPPGTSVRSAHEAASRGLARSTTCPSPGRRRYGDRGNRREHVEVDGSREYSCNGKASHRLEYGFRRRWFSFGDAAHLRHVTLRWRTQIVKKRHCSGMAMRSRVMAVIF